MVSRVPSARRECANTGRDVLLVDTAGRLQNKQDLMDELTKMVRVLRKLDPDAPHEVLLVLDATVGRNALAQENVFGNMIGVTGIVMTKLDGTARGGVLVPVAQASDSPIKLVGVGEKQDALEDFHPERVAGRILGQGDILVTRVAGPALSHILPRVAGVVAELGGSTSHMASLARERGIPMVLGVLDATRKIPDGVQCAVDGVAGVVRWQR